MTDYSQILKELHTLHMLADSALKALQERVAELESLAYLADAALIQSHGCFPLDRTTDEERFLNDVASALRAVTGEDYAERRARTAQALALLSKENNHAE